MTRNRRTRIRFQVLGDYTITVIQSSNFERTGRRMKADLEGCDAAWVKDPDEPMHCWLIFGLSPDAETIAHEASHAVRAMFKAVGVVGKKDDETFAYHLGYLVGRLHKFLK